VPTAPGASQIIQPGAQWGVAKWGVDVWPQTLLNQSLWLSAPGFGSVLSPVIQLTVSTALAPDVRLTAIDVLYESGNPMG
jgi:hypothetical protein